MKILRSFCLAGAAAALTVVLADAQAPTGELTRAQQRAKAKAQNVPDIA